MAIRDINADTSILPHTTLLTRDVETNCDRLAALEAAQNTTLNNLNTYVAGTGGPTLAIIGPFCSSAAQSMNYIFNYRHVPVVAHGASSHILSDKDQFPWFTRTVSSILISVYGLEDHLI